MSTTHLYEQALDHLMEAGKLMDHINLAVEEDVAAAEVDFIRAALGEVQRMWIHLPKTAEELRRDSRSKQVLRECRESDGDSP